jgi:hypothetical protein
MRVKQGGFSIFEMIVATALTSLIVVWSATTWVQQSEDAASDAMGRWLMTIKHSVDQMLVRQSDLLTGVSVSGPTSGHYQDVWRPALSELVRAGHLSTGFSLRAPLGYDLSIKVLKPRGLCLTQGCKLEALTIATPNISQRQKAGTMTRLGKIMASFGGQGASVTQLSPERVRGPIVDLPNPPEPEMPLLPIGSIVLHSFFDSSAQAGFLRQRDRRNVELGADLKVAGRLTTAGAIHSAGNMTSKGSISAGGGITAAGPIFTSGRVSSSEYLQLGAVANQGAACDADGLIAQSASKGLLVCQSGIWQNSTKSGGGHYIDRLDYPCHARDEVLIDRRNPMTGDCSCPIGYKPLLISVWRYPFHSYNEYFTYLCLN